MANGRDAVTKEETVAKDRFLQGAIKRPGRVKRAAKRDGLSVGQEARKMAHSGNKSEEAAGNLALRFKGMAKHGNIRHGKRKARKRASGKRY